jgi:hypothetical protein
VHFRKEFLKLHKFCNLAFITLIQSLNVDKNEEREGDYRFLPSLEEDFSLQVLEIEAGQTKSHKQPKRVGLSMT